jgi:Ca2+-binding RTX toxin-like protein
MTLSSLRRWTIRERRAARRQVKLQSSRKPQFEKLEDRCLLSADMVLRWNAVAIEAAKIDHGIGEPGIQFGPTRTSRALAIVQAAVYDAVDSIDPQYTPYLIQVQAPAGASMDAAVAQAAHDTLVALYPYQQPYFDAQLASSLPGIPVQSAAEGVAVGATVAQYILAARANDGSQVDAVGQPEHYVYGQLPGQWRADPLHPNALPLTPDWGSVTPFVIQSATQFEPPPPPAITSLAYAQAYQEVKAIGSMDSTVRTDVQTDVGLFWGYDAQPGLCAPIRFYNQIAEVVARQKRNTEVQNARFFALINFAMADAGITCWGAKYGYDLWRPVTAIRENDPGTGPTGLGSGNPYLVGQGDPSWTPLGAPADNGNGTNFTPPFPSYTSGHASFGGALFKMMADYYGTDNVQFTIISDEFNTITVDQNGIARPLMPRTYDSFSQAAGENAQSRIYLGIHYPFDAVEGIRSGDNIADYVFQHAAIPLQGPAPTPIPSMDPAAQISLALSLENAAGSGIQVVGTQLYIGGGLSTNDQIQVTPIGASNTGSTGVHVTATLNGTQFSESFNQSFTAIQILGYGGNDNILLAGTLTIQTYVNLGDGNDNILAGNGNNIITFGNGNDNILVGNGNNTITLGSGNDNLLAGDGTNTIALRNGNDNILVGNGNNTITLGSGNDNLLAGDGTNTVQAGAMGSTANIHVQLGNGANNSVTLLGNGNDQVRAGNGANDSVSITGDGNDRVKLGDGDDDSVSLIGNGNDQVEVGNGTNDFVSLLGNGNDSIHTGIGTGEVHVAGTGRKNLRLGNGWIQI